METSATPAGMTALGLELHRRLPPRPLTDCYLGRHAPTGATVFVKALRSGLPGVVRNFRREMACLADLQDLDGAPRLVAADRDGEPPFHACGWVEGEPLTRAAAAGAGIGDLVACAAPLARWLAALHARGYAHRDLSPDHVFLGPGGEASVVDFGLAKPDAAALELGYDVQALGLILWELVCGQPLFDYRGPQLARQIGQQVEVVRTVGLPPELEAFLVRTLGAPSEATPDGLGWPPIDAAEASAWLGRIAAA